MWQNAPPEQKKRYMDDEAKAREEYKMRMGEWRIEFENKKKKKKDPLEIFEEAELERKRRGIPDEVPPNDDDDDDDSSDEKVQPDVSNRKRPTKRAKSETPSSHAGVTRPGMNNNVRGQTLDGLRRLNDLVQALGEPSSSYTLEQLNLTGQYHAYLSASQFLGHSQLAPDVLRSRLLLTPNSLALNPLCKLTSFISMIVLCLLCTPPPPRANLRYFSISTCRRHHPLSFSDESNSVEKSS
jgi:hypothetical protein